MKIYKLPEAVEVSSLPRGCAACLGNFDGVHRGHQRLFDVAREDVNSKTAVATCAWCFTSLAKPGLSVPFITDMRAKLALFSDYGLDYAVFEDFEAVRDMSAASFVRNLLVKKLCVASVSCGFNFRFGSGGTGDAGLLSSLLGDKGVKCTVLRPVTRAGHIISSSLIRERILNGDMEGAADLLDHPFFINFPVLRGKQLGRTIGIPTINQDFPTGHIIPRGGIYACTVTVGDYKYLGVANVGSRPTVSTEGRINCETHIINYDGFLYGNEIRVDFYSRLRGEKRFPSIDELRGQIFADIEATKDYFAARNIKNVRGNSK